MAMVGAVPEIVGIGKATVIAKAGNDAEPVALVAVTTTSLSVPAVVGA